MKGISRNVTLVCPLCGNDQFSSVDCELNSLKEAPGETQIKCSDCGRITTKDVLIQDNQEIINANIEDIKKEAVSEAKKEIEKMLKKLR